MPRFYFNVIGRTAEIDEVGTDLLSAGHAKREGIGLAGALVTADFMTHHGGRVLLEVTDEEGLALFHVDVASWESPALRALTDEPAA